MDGKKVLVTGAGGFIGQNLCRYLTEGGMDVIGACHKRQPAWPMKKFFSCDLAQDDMEEIMGGERIDAIIHCAGQMRGEKVSMYLRNTVGSTGRLIHYAEQAGVRKFIYMSSISVYGETMGAVDEFSDRINLDDYGMAKYLCERLLEDSGIESRVVIRLPRTLGKGCDLSYPWLPKVAGQMLKDEDIYYSNPKLPYNNMLHVDDLSEFLLHLLRGDRKGLERFVLGAGGRMRIIDILELLKRELSSTSALIEKPAVGRNKCHAIRTGHAEEVGFCPRGCEETIRSFVKSLIQESMDGEE